MQHLASEDRPIEICYRDEDLLVIHKPPGMAVHPGLGCHRGTVLNFLRHLLPEDRYGDEALRRMPVHRLDKATSGLLLLGLNEKAQSSLHQQFEQGRVEKVYEAWVWGTPAQSVGLIEIPVGRPPGDPHSITEDPTAQFGKPSITCYQCMEHRRGLTRTRLIPQTGRTHQLRIHMAWLGHPIVGDRRYGSVREEEIMFPEANRERLFLHAGSLKLRHPSTHREIKLICVAPDPF